MVFHIIRTQKKPTYNIGVNHNSSLFLHYTLTFELFACQVIENTRTGPQVGFVVFIVQNLFFFFFYKCSSLGICYVRWFLQWFFPDLNGFWFKIYEHWLTVTLLMRCNFVSAFQKLRVNKTNEIMYMSFCQTWYNKLIWPNNNLAVKLIHL